MPSMAFSFGDLQARSMARTSLSEEASGTSKPRAAGQGQLNATPADGIQDTGRQLLATQPDYGQPLSVPCRKPESGDKEVEPKPQEAAPL